MWYIIAIIEYIRDISQVKNYEEVGILGTLPKLKINGSASAKEGNSSLEFATDDFPALKDAESKSKSISGNVEFSYNLFNGLGSIYTYQKLKKQSDLKSIELLLQIEQVLIKTAKQYYDIAYLQEYNKILEEVQDELKKETPLTQRVINGDENIALNVLVSFVSLAQRRGAFALDEASKIYECIEVFRKPRSNSSSSVNELSN